MMTDLKTKRRKRKICNLKLSDERNLKSLDKFACVGVKIHECESCSRSFAFRSHLKQHIFSHTGEKPHKCTSCSRSFATKGNLARHMSIHTGEKPYECDECNILFEQKGHLSRHMLPHNKEETFKCCKCGKFCRRKVHLRGPSIARNKKGICEKRKLDGMSKNVKCRKAQINQTWKVTRPRGSKECLKRFSRDMINQAALPDQQEASTPKCNEDLGKDEVTKPVGVKYEIKECFVMMDRLEDLIVMFIEYLTWRKQIEEKRRDFNFDIDRMAFDVAVKRNAKEENGEVLLERGNLEKKALDLSCGECYDDTCCIPELGLLWKIIL